MAMFILGFAASAFSQAPVITTQPQSQAVVVGSNVVMSVSASGAAPISYQWRLNGTVMPKTIITSAGNGSAGSSGDGGPATNAALNYPFGVAVGLSCAGSKLSISILNICKQLPSSQNGAIA